jgi:hypothetical protein
LRSALAVDDRGSQLRLKLYRKRLASENRPEHRRLEDPGFVKDAAFPHPTFFTKRFGTLLTVPLDIEGPPAGEDGACPEVPREAVTGKTANALAMGSISQPRKVERRIPPDLDEAVCTQELLKSKPALGLYIAGVGIDLRGQETPVHPRRRDHYRRGLDPSQDFGPVTQRATAKLLSCR